MRISCRVVAVCMLAQSGALFAQGDGSRSEEHLAMSARDELPATTVPLTDEDYEELFRRYMEASHRAPRRAATTGTYGWMTDLAFDHTGRRANDIVTVHVIESTDGTGTADTALAKTGSNLLSLSNFLGLEGRLPSSIDPANLINSLTETDHQGSGTTNRTSTLTAIVSARVAEVLPNGDLVLEGVREIDINGDRQVLLLTGVARPEDIGTDNVVRSASLGQLRIRYFGEGLIKDTVKPGWITRMLNKVF